MQQQSRKAKESQSKAKAQPQQRQIRANVKQSQAKVRAKEKFQPPAGGGESAGGILAGVPNRGVVRRFVFFCDRLDLGTFSSDCAKPFWLKVIAIGPANA